MTINFQQISAKKRELVWGEIQKYLKTPKFSGKLAISKDYLNLMDFHWNMVSAYPQRLGKYIRPALVLLSAQAMGVSEEKAILTAAAMQTSEDWILIHDDLEDNSTQRRGEAALHRIYGSELAVNAGDSLHVLMWKMLWDNRKLLGDEKAAEIADEFYQMLQRTTFGQTVEIKWTKENRQDLTDEDIFLILDGKTSYYTIAGPMRLGAILGGASQDQKDLIWEFGQNLGRCFQIVDDLLDLTSDFQGLKKQTGNDIYEGKRTLMLMHLLRNASWEDKTKLQAILNKSREEKLVKEVEWVIEKMQEYGSLDYSRGIAKDFATKALEMFETKLGFLSHQPARDQLRAGIDFILKRDH
jgi:geranylgeranyl diphosphate synthase type II